MTRLDLIKRLSARYPMLARDTDLAVRTMLEAMFDILSRGGRVEVRGFGCFDVRLRPPRSGRNPKTGRLVTVNARHALHFRPAERLKTRINHTPEILP